MKKQFIPYDLAVKLKDLGFDEPCLAYFKDSVFILERIDKFGEVVYEMDSIEIIKAPLWQQAFDWFLETHDLYHHILKGFGWQTIIRGSNTNDIKWHDGTYNSPHEAKTACLEKLIKLCK